MSTITATHRARGLMPRLGTPGWARMTYTEGRIYLRDLGNIVFVLAFPSLLLLGMSYAIPGMRDSIADTGTYAGLSPAILYIPVVICVSIATAGLSALPNYLASYRETGVLTRLSTTPMRPQGLLLSQVTINLVGMLLGAAIAVTAGFILLDAPRPENPAAVIGLITPAAGAIFGIGMIIGGLASKASTANGIGMLLYFPMLFFAGMWTPGPTMPSALASISGYTPLGAASQAMTDAWFTGAVDVEAVIVMLVWTAVTFTVAARTFRWQ